MWALAISKKGKERGLKFMVLLLLYTALVFSMLLPALKASAFSPSYNPSNLIDNPTFTDKNSMSAAAIQAFLSNVKGGLAGYTDIEACDPSIAAYFSHCGQRLSAAQIIYDTAQAYGMSPRTILATLEKEQSLVTDPSPSASQINCAMGYNSCSNYVGFFTQVENGTWILRYNYEGAFQHDTWLSWHPGSNYPCSTAHSGFYSSGLYPGNTVTFANAGGSPRTVTLANAATASLYCYTPYVGPWSETGYSGSYNFVYYFQLWFGSTQTSTPYAWSYEGQSAYINSSHTQVFNATPTVAPGGSLYMQVKARNIGYQTWSQSNLHLGTSNPNDRSSQLYDGSWLSPVRPAGLVEVSVAPGETGTFNFTLHTPQQTGTYNEYFNLVADGITWLNDLGLYFTVNVVAPVAASNTQNTGLASGQSISVNQGLLSPDTQSTLKLQSDGNLVLYSNFKPAWATYNFNPAASLLVMQGDGNLVEYDKSGNPVWSSSTSGSGNHLELQTDGNLVIYSGTGQPLWFTSTGQVPDHLSYVNTTIASVGLIFPGQALQTANRQYAAVLQSDGNFVVYKGAQALWSSQSYGKSVAFGAMQADGNFVLYSPSGAPVWYTRTAGGGSSLVMQSDGNLVIYGANGGPTWASIR
jgi:hypothetical protein